MNKDINYTLAALVPLLRMNGEKVVSVEAVEDWYEIDGREYMKEVAEITYENGYRQYADIGCDANLTAVYDVIRVIQQMKPKSEKIERIVRDVYPNPEVPDTNVGAKHGTNLASLGTDCISRQSAIDAIDEYMVGKICATDGTMMARLINELVIKQLPSVQLDTYWEEQCQSYEQTINKLRESLSTQPEIKQQAINSSDCIDRRAALDALRKMQTYKLFSGDDMLLIDQAGAQTELMLLPSAQPKQRTGKWAILGDMCSVRGYWATCSVCGRTSFGGGKFCRECGAKMGVTDGRD